MSGLPMARLRVAAVAGSALLTGASRRGGRGDRLRRPGRAASGAGRWSRTIPSGSCGPRPWPGRCCWCRRPGRPPDPDRAGAEAGRGHRPVRRPGLRPAGLARGAELAVVTAALDHRGPRRGPARPGLVLEAASLTVSRRRGGRRGRSQRRGQDQPAARGPGPDAAGGGRGAVVGSAGRRAEARRTRRAGRLPAAGTPRGLEPAGPDGRGPRRADLPAGQAADIWRCDAWPGSARRSGRSRRAGHVGRRAGPGAAGASAGHPRAHCWSPTSRWRAWIPTPNC
jgi:hypothetical protein